MKIAKSKLMQIIKEEYQKLQEGYGEAVDKKALEEAIYALEDKVMPVIFGTPLERMANELHKRIYAMVEGRSAAMQEEREIFQLPDGSAVAQVIDLLENLESELHIEAGTHRSDSHEKQQFAETAGRLRQMVQQALQLLSQASGKE